MNLEEVEALRADCDAMGREFVAKLRERTGKLHDVLGIPVALAAVFDELITQNKVDLDSFYLKETVGKLVAMRLERYAPGIEALHAKLVEIGATSNSAKVNNGGDNYVYAIPKTYQWRYGLICETQNRTFVVLMRYGRKGENHPDKFRKSYAKHSPKIDQEYLEHVLKDLYSPQIYIAQKQWNENRSEQLSVLEALSHTDGYNLPSWADDRNPHDGYVAFLKDGEVDGAIHHYGKICYCLYSLASHIECKDEFEAE